MDDWDEDDSPQASGTSTPASAPVAPVARAPARGKWADEDAEDEQDDWDASEDEKPKAATTGVAAAPKKKKTLKQKLAEKEAAAAEARAQGGDGEVGILIDNRTEQDRRREARERELEADLKAAEELMGASGISDGPETLQAILSSNPKTKEDFAKLSSQIATVILARHTVNPLYPSFAETLAKDICESLNAVQTRKVSSALGVLGNTKQQDERDKASGKKPKATKPKLGSAKAENKVDTGAYDDVLEDDDFM